MTQFNCYINQEHGSPFDRGGKEKDLKIMKELILFAFDYACGGIRVQQAKRKQGVEEQADIARLRRLPYRLYEVDLKGDLSYIEGNVTTSFLQPYVDNYFKNHYFTYKLTR
jgi:hypothetical protein